LVFSEHRLLLDCNLCNVMLKEGAVIERLFPSKNT